jgi:hypothetical protein
MRPKLANQVCDCVIARVAIGAPPNGQEKRRASTSTCATGCKKRRGSLPNINSSAMPCRHEKKITVKMYPGMEMYHIQAKVGKNQPRPSENPATNDCRADVAFCETL